MSTAFRRVAVVAAPAMILSGLAIAAGPDAVAAPPYDQSPIAAASAWDSSQMTGNLLTTNFGGTEFKDYGLSADYAISLADVGGRAVTVSAISAAVANEVDSYVSDGLGSPTESYAGPLAKSIVLAKAAAADPTSYGGKNLVSLLEARVGTGAPSHPTGRIADLSAFGDFANVFGQAYAAQALKSVGSPQTGAVTDFLLQQQCSTGFFRLNFADAAAADQSCDGASPAATPDTDVTAYAVIALRSQAGDPDVDTALSKAVAYLKATQKADGSFG